MEITNIQRHKNTPFELYELTKHIPYQLGVWDCLHLAKFLCDEIRGYGIFPDILQKYESIIDEKVASEMILKDVPTYCTRVDVLLPGCIVILDIMGQYLLASYYTGLIFYMDGAGARCSPVNRIHQYIHSCWEIIIQSEY
jgi:hypothetical protein